jgi:hypothetical protein
LILVAVAGLVRGDFFDDFESYALGEDPDVSYSWEREPSGGQVLVTEQGDNQVAEAFFPDSTHIAYLCSGAGFWDNGSVEIDFSPNGSGSFTNVFARMQLLSGEAYVGGVTVFLQPFTYAYIAYINVSGEYELLYSDFGPSIFPGSWVNVDLHVEGYDPVILTLYTNGQEVASVIDSQYILGSGLSGFALFYEEEKPVVYLDNFRVTLTAQALQATTFAAVKALFR